ncbi:MAG: hypothetical protein ACRDQU_16490 [Pseudonocardiaceae bacterium]
MIIGRILWVHYHRQRAIRQPLPRLANVNPLLAAKLATPITIVLAILLACLLVLTVLTFIAVFTSAPGVPLSGADVGVTVLVTLCTAACAYRLYRHLSFSKWTLNGQMRRFQACCNRLLDRLMVWLHWFADLTGRR